MDNQPKLNEKNPLHRLSGRYLKWTAYGLLILGAGLLQMAPRVFPAVFGARPLLLIPIVVSIAMFEGPVGGAAAGIAGGLLWDLYADRLFGFSALFLMAICCACGLLVRLLIRNNLLSAMLLFSGALLTQGLMDWFFNYVLWMKEDPLYMLGRMLLPDMAYTLVVSPLLYGLTLLIAKTLAASGTDAALWPEKGATLYDGGQQGQPYEQTPFVLYSPAGHDGLRHLRAASFSNSDRGGGSLQRAGHPQNGDKNQHRRLPGRNPGSVSAAHRGQCHQQRGAVRLQLFSPGHRRRQQKLQNDIILRLVTLLGEAEETWNDTLPITRKAPYAFEEERDASIAALKKNLNMADYATAEHCMKALVEAYHLAGYTAEEQRAIAGVRYEMSIRDFTAQNAYVFSSGVSRETMYKIMENNTEYPGVDVQATPVRKYVQGDVAAHLIGQVGPIYAEEYEELKEKGYALNDKVGKGGIEAAMEDSLRGTTGTRTLVKDAKGNVLEEKETKAPSPANRWCSPSIPTCRPRCSRFSRPSSRSCGPSPPPRAGSLPTTATMSRAARWSCWTCPTAASWSAPAGPASTWPPMARTTPSWSRIPTSPCSTGP